MTADTLHFQQAKKPTREPWFLQIVAKPDQVTRGKSKGKPAQKLTRVAFRVSWLMEFCTKRELQNQTGHSADDWPLVVLKELMDNSLDPREEAEIAPPISLGVRPGSITIRDNGGGIETQSIESILDYTIRVSSREAYVSPTRGAQGNALKTILAMGYVLDRESEDEDSINGEAAHTKHPARNGPTTNQVLIDISQNVALSNSTARLHAGYQARPPPQKKKAPGASRGRQLCMSHRNNGVCHD
jgi:hypothetical protein